MKDLKPDDLAEAKKQLTELFVERQEFWLGAPELPFRFSLRAPRDGDDKPLLALVRKHFSIDRTGLFTRPDGRPCAYQTLTVREPDQLAAALNAEITSVMAASAKEELAKPATETAADTDRETWRLIERACRGKFDWLDEFDVKIWSCEKGCAKPDAVIYRDCLRQLECEPGKSVQTRPRMSSLAPWRISLIRRVLLVPSVTEAIDAVSGPVAPWL